MAEPAHKYSYLWENTLSGLYQINKNTILPSLFIFYFLFCTWAKVGLLKHISALILGLCPVAIGNRATPLDREWVKSRVRPNSLSFWSGKWTGEGEKKIWCTNSSTPVTEQLLKLQLFISSLWFKSMDRKWKKTYSGVEMWNYFSIKIWVKGCLFFVKIVIFRMS